MAQQSLLYPQGSLLIVDKSMRKKRPSNPYESQPLQLTDKDIKVAVLGTSTTGGQLTQQRRESVKDGRRTFRFVASVPERRRPKRRRRQPNSTKEGCPGRADTDTSTNSSSPTVSSASQILCTIPRSSSPFYGRIEGVNPSVADILPYYSNMTYFFYPLQPHLALKFDPVKTIYLPESLNDICMLNAIVTTAAYRLQGVLGLRPESGVVFFQTAIQEMQRRISNGDITDAVLMATTCFILRDYCQGQITESQTHLNGMLRMLDVRGGFSAVYPGFRQKLYRALLGPAIDFLCPPRWPRPQRDRPSLYTSLRPKRNHSFATLLRHANLPPPLSKVMLRVHQLSLSINHAIIHATPVDPFSLDQDIMTIQHDLLCLHTTLPTLLPTTTTTTTAAAAAAALSRACIPAALVFTRLLTRELPLALLNSETLPTAMISLANTIAIIPETAVLRFWCFFMGALAAQETDRKLLLLGDVRRSCIALGIETWEGAKRRLLEVAWVERGLEGDGERLFRLLELA